MKLRYTAEFELRPGMFTKPEDSATVDMDALAEQLNSLVADFTEDGKLDFSLSVLENLHRKQGNVQNSKRNTHRADIKPGMTVDIVLKKDQPTGKLTRGVVGRILTNSADHHRGIKVMLTDGQVGRVQHIID